MSELICCPFCGKEAFVEKRRDQYVVMCFHRQNCYLIEARGPKYNVREALVKQWNRRKEKENARIGENVTN